MRIAGIKDLMHETTGVTFEFIDEGSWNLARDGYSIGRRLAKRPASERPDFVIALSDVLATGAIAGIQSAGLSVPDDIKVVGSDGNPLAWSGNVPLTTIAPPGYEIGRKGVQYLIAQIEDNRRRATPCPPRIIRLWCDHSCSHAQAPESTTPPTSPIRTWISAGTCRRVRQAPTWVSPMAARAALRGQALPI